MRVAEKQVLIAANPRSGASSSMLAARQLVEILEQRGLVPILETSIEALRHRTEQAKRFGDLRCLVGVGGDGTVSLLAGLSEGKIPIAILPAGTENLLARQIGIPPSPSLVADCIINMQVDHFDMGTIESLATPADFNRAWSGTIPFLLMVGVGFDAEVVRQVHTQRKGHISKFSYAIPILRSIFSYRYPKFRIETDEGQVETGCWCFAVNFPRYAGELSFVPDADPQDGLIDICGFRGGGFMRAMRYLRSIHLGTQSQLADHFVVRSKRVTIATVDGAVNMWTAAADSAASDKNPRSENDLSESDHAESEAQRDASKTSGSHLQNAIKGGPEAYFQHDGDFGNRLPIQLAVVPSGIPLVVPYTVS